jgi:HD-GYP domain-containing protein (c-di-GMP phosphodiesterase class II)
MGFSRQDQKDVFLAGLVHDIGAISSEENLYVIENEPIKANNHAFLGASLLEGFKPLKNIAPIVRFHHIPWNDGKNELYQGCFVSLHSHVLHLADRFCASLKYPYYNILSQVPNILEDINKKAGSIFEPSLVSALNELSRKEYIWLDLISQDPINRLPDNGLSEQLVLEIDDILDFAILLSHIIDFRSKFTACHSAGVAMIAEYLAALLGFSPIECKMMLIAGYLHDLGKLAIDNTILEKQEKLNSEEFNQIRGHTYYTYTLLDRIEQFDTIKIWAAFHHERLDGKGYPFHIPGENLPLGSRIMAVADVFTAITEDRPYRKRMERDQVLQVLDSLVSKGALDGNVVKTLEENFDSVYSIISNCYDLACKQYDDFIDMPIDNLRCF